VETPIYDFVTDYIRRGPARLHMPGHKGASVLGCEARDITEVAGADALYEAEGIIAQSEKNATALFGTGRTLYGTEGSSQGIRTMLALAAQNAPGPAGERPLILAGRNAHRVFVTAAALLDLEVRWLWPEGEDYALCRCPLSPAGLERALDGLERPAAGVYVTSPDYLGGELDIRALAEVCHARGVPLLVDNAHGAYLRFLPESRHPMDLGADVCCDSAHKTLPVLTGGAYLHVSKTAPASFLENARQAMALFGSTSPSYLILQSLDLANRALAEDYPARLKACVARLEALKEELETRGWYLEPSDPLKLTVDAAGSGWEGAELAERLRRGGVECEYAGPDGVVLMFTPGNAPAELERLAEALGENPRREPLPRPALGLTPPTVACSLRQALFAPRETVAAEAALGRVLAVPTVSCPPAVPVVVCGEVIGPDALALFRRYGIEEVVVRKEPAM
jgi:arginine decarboxylase